MILELKIKKRKYKNIDFEKEKKSTAPGIPRWSPSQVLTRLDAA